MEKELFDTLIEHLESVNPYSEANRPNQRKNVPEYVTDCYIGYNTCIEKLKAYADTMNIEPTKGDYKLPGHDKTISNLESLTIRPN